MSFNGSDYDYLFKLGRSLFYSRSTAERREIAVTLMAMAESVRGQQAGWPNVPKRYRIMTTYPPTVESNLFRFIPK